MIIKKKYHFYAAHRNKQAGEKCGRIHGHTYEVECYFKFSDFTNGVAKLFSDIDALVEPIIKAYCHYFLLHDKDSLCKVLSDAKEPYIALPFETSAENMSIWFFNKIKDETKLPIYRIELSETKSSTIIYEP